MDELQYDMDPGLYVSGDVWLDFLVRLLVNILSLFILIRFVYYPNNSRVKFIFTFFLMGMMIFLIAIVLNRIRLQIGIAFGLFAIFGIIRYRSPSIDLKEMTYLFITMGVAMINALVDFSIEDWFGLVIANFIIISTAFFMEMYKPKNNVLKRTLVFPLQDLSVLNNNEMLLEEVKKHTGINILKVEIEKINKARNEVIVWIYFYSKNKLDQEVELVQEEPEETKDMWESTSSNDYP